MIERKKEQAGDEKSIDPYTALEKIMKLERKHTTFDYHDHLLSAHIHVKYPPLKEPIHGQHLLKQFWRHMQNFYFKRIDTPQLQRLEYFNSLIDPQSEFDFPLKAPEDFWTLVQDTFSSSYMKRYLRSEMDTLDTKNWYCTLYGYYHLLDGAEHSSKKVQKQQLKRLQECKNCLQGAKDNERYLKGLQKEQKFLRKMFPDSHYEKNQVTDEIESLEQQLKELNRSNCGLMDQLNKKVIKQFQPKDMLIQMQQIDVQVKYLKYLILILEKKQVAQSIAKIVKIQKNRWDTKFLVNFETGMNIKPKLVSQQELLELNQLRQYSLLKFYNTSLKSKYSFICQNFLGFRQIYNNREKPCKYKEANILELMKKSNTEIKDKSVKGFETFFICHHCKLLYPDNLIVSCRYNSIKMGAPIIPFTYYDPYTYQIYKNEPPGTNQRQFNRRRNPFMSYTKTDDQYYCDRRFCKFCLKQNYQQGIDKNGLCPFCQGICFCTRCARNDMISRLKSIYIHFGGNIDQIIKESYLEALSPPQIQQQQRVKKKGRPKKIQRKHVVNHSKSYQKLISIRYSMQDCRMICDLVKRRQKTKQKLIISSKDCMDKKIRLVAKDYDYKRILSEMDWRDDLDEEILNSKKIQKRLKRLN